MKATAGGASGEIAGEKPVIRQLSAWYIIINAHCAYRRAHAPRASRYLPPRLRA
jgi:hypothetical protein